MRPSTVQALAVVKALEIAEKSKNKAKKMRLAADEHR